MAANLDHWPKTLEIENPKRIDDFLAALENLDWSTAPASATAYERLADQSLRLVRAEVAYYYRRRGLARYWSIVARFVIWLAGSIGVLVPIIAPLAPAIAMAEGKSAPLLQLGYVALAMAGVAAAFDRVFGFSTNHGRYVATQYRLEEVMVLFKVDWEEWRAMLAGAEPNEKQRKAGFDLVRAMLKSAYRAISGETQEWHADVIRNRDKHSRKA